MNYFKRQSGLVLSANAGSKGNRAWRPIVDSGQFRHAGNAGSKGKKRGCREHKFNSATCRDNSHQFTPFFQHAAAAGDPEPNPCRDQARRRALRNPRRPVGGGTACSTSAAAASAPRHCGTLARQPALFAGARQPRPCAAAAVRPLSHPGRSPRSLARRCGAHPPGTSPAASWTVRRVGDPDAAGAFAVPAWPAALACLVKRAST